MAHRSFYKFPSSFVISMIAVPFILVSTVVLAINWDWELRCCLTKTQIKNVFMISLIGKKRPVAHLQLITPNSRIHGYNPKLQAFYPPDDEGLYASGPVTMPIDDAEWDKHRPRRLLLKRLHKGRYKVKVIGLAHGEYHLMFQPGGAPQVGPGSRNSLVDVSFYKVRIRAGEIHTYTFNGTYSDIYKGGIPRNSPGSFRVMRLH